MRSRSPPARARRRNRRSHRRDRRSAPRGVVTRSSPGADVEDRPTCGSSRRPPMSGGSARRPPARSIHGDAAVLHEDRAVAELRDGLHVVRDEQDRASVRTEVLHAAEAPPLELRVTDCEHLVDEQDLGLEMRSDRERESHVHAARVALHGRVEEPLDPRELDHVGKLLLDLASLHARGSRRSSRCSRGR